MLSMAVMAMLIPLSGCSSRVEETPAYQAACHGPALRSLEQREKAMEEGYSINPQYNCIDKASFTAIERQRAEWQAANTPEAIARRKAELAEKHELYLAELAEKAAAEASREPERFLAVELVDVDVNSASVADIARVITISPNTAAKIIEERNKRPFSGWADLVNRVVGLGAAQTAYYASVCGLTVNGLSLDGAPPDPTMAAMLQRKYQQYQSK